MARTFLNITVIVSAFVLAGAAHAETMKGTCAVSVSAHSGKKFVTLKCYKESDPGDYKIRSTVWDKDDHARYGRLARLAGRQFACDLTTGGTIRDAGMEISRYQITKCR